MTYGWCWSSGCIGSPPPGPISPMHWLTTVTTYAKRKVPADKIVLGVNLYGYDWSPVASGQHSLECGEASRSSPHSVLGPLSMVLGSIHCIDGISATALTWPDADALIQTHQPDIQWWESNDRGLVREHWFLYGEDHGVTYADRDSVAARWDLAAELGISGIVMWYLGAEDPAIWSIFSENEVTPSPTPTASVTPSPTETTTATPSPTLTPSPSPTASVTSSPTWTATVTSSPSPTSTWTPTALPTNTATATSTITSTPTKTATVTSIATTTHTPTPKPVQTPTRRPTKTATSPPAQARTAGLYACCAAP